MLLISPLLYVSLTLQYTTASKLLLPFIYTMSTLFTSFAAFQLSFFVMGQNRAFNMLAYQCVSLLWLLNAVDLHLRPNVHLMLTSCVLSHIYVSVRLLYLTLAHSRFTKHLLQFMSLSEMYDVSITIPAFVHLSFVMGTWQTCVIFVSLYVCQCVLPIASLHALGPRKDNAKRYQGNPFREQS